jgi:hypothetical protein
VVNTRLRSTLVPCCKERNAHDDNDHVIVVGVSVGIGRDSDIPFVCDVDKTDRRRRRSLVWSSELTPEEYRPRQWYSLVTRKYRNMLRSRIEHRPMWCAKFELRRLAVLGMRAWVVRAIVEVFPRVLLMGREGGRGGAMAVGCCWGRLLLAVDGPSLLLPFVVVSWCCRYCEVITPRTVVKSFLDSTVTSIGLPGSLSFL